MNEFSSVNRHGSAAGRLTDFYSTHGSGSNDRHASTAQAPYQTSTACSSLEHNLEQQLGFAHSNSGQLGSWDVTFGLQQQNFHSQQSFSVNPGELRDLFRSEDEAPWSGFRGTSTLPEPHLWTSSSNVSKAYTIAGGHVSPSLQRHVRFHDRDSLNDSVDSGFESRGQPSSDDPASLSQVYVFQSGSRPTSRGDAVPPPPKSVKSDSHLQVAGAAAKRRRTKTAVSICPVCNKDLKNQSDAIKHEFTHTKPFPCEEPGCNRTYGFATQNDLQRHRKSVHGARPSVGKETGYICQACTKPNSGNVPKWWPRLDNFKAHIDRKHREWNQKELIERSEAPMPADAMSESGYASQRRLSHAVGEPVYQFDLTSPMEMTMSSQASHHGGMSLFDLDHAQPNALAGIGEGDFNNPFLVSSNDVPGYSEPLYGSNNDAMAVLYDAALQQAPPGDEMMSPTAANHDSSRTAHASHPHADEPSSTVNQLQWDNSLSKMAIMSGPSKLHSVIDPSENLRIYRTNSGGYKCPKCPKVKGRECDLRKHMKRHTRPYGCTFPNCYKNFGGRYDWKRHENSRHVLHEMWRCELSNADGTVCRKLFESAECFVTHLYQRHDLKPDSAETLRCQRDMHLGREANHQYWCGFCNCLIKQDEGMHQDGVPRSPWVMRFRHIGDHFDKGKLHIDNWVCIEHNKPKILISKEDRKKGKNRLKTECTNDESDLGEDGIPSPHNSNYGLFASADVDSKMTTRASKRKVDEMDADADGVSDSE